MEPSQSQDTQHVVDPEPQREKDWTHVCCAFIVRFIMAWMLKLILSFLIKAFLQVDVPGWGTYIVCLACTLQLKDPPMRQPKSAPKCDPREIGDWVAQIKKVLDQIEKTIQEHGKWIDESGTVFRDTFMNIHKRQKEQLRLYEEFKKQHGDEFGAIVSVLEGHRREMAENSRAAAEENTSLCNIIAQYRATVEENQTAVEGHMSSINTAFKDERILTAQTREFADKRYESIQNTLDSHAKLIEENMKLVREHGTSIDKVVCDHASLVAEYQKALDDLAMLITANRVFALIHETSDWKSFEGHTERVVAEEDLAEDAQQLIAQEDEERTEKLKPGIGPAELVDNLQQITRTYRDISAEMSKAALGNDEGAAQRDWLLARGNSPKGADGHDRTPDTSSRMEQMMATVFGQLTDTLRSTVESRHAEEMRQLLQGQEDMKKLRADLKPLQEFSQLLRDIHEVQDDLRRIKELIALRDEEARLKQERREEEAARRKQREVEVRRLVREEMDRRAAEEKANATSATTPTTTTGLTATTDEDTVTLATITNPTHVTYPKPVSAATSTDDDEEDGGALYYYSDDDGDAEALADVNGVDGAGDDGEGRLMGDFLGCMLAHED